VDLHTTLNAKSLLDLKTYWKHFRREGPLCYGTVFHASIDKRSSFSPKKSASAPAQLNSRAVISTGSHRKQKVSIAALCFSPVTLRTLSQTTKPGNQCSGMILGCLRYH